MTSNQDEQAAAVEVRIDWQNVDMVFFDQLMGFTMVDNMPRAALGQLVFAPNSTGPAARPVMHMAGTTVAWARIRDQINEMLVQVASEGSAELKVDNSIAAGRD